MRALIVVLVIVLSFPLIQRDVSAQNTSLLSAGLSAGGGGWIGVPVQIRPHKNFALDFGVYLRAAHSKVFEPVWFISPGLDAGFSIFLKHRDHPNRNRICSSGVYVRAGMARSDLDEEMIGIGYVREFRKPDKASFLQLQIGPTAVRRTETYMNTRYPPGFQEMTEGPWWTGMIHARISWFFGLF